MKICPTIKKNTYIKKGRFLNFFYPTIFPRIKRGQSNSFTKKINNNKNKLFACFDFG